MAEPSHNPKYVYVRLGTWFMVLGSLLLTGEAFAVATGRIVLERDNRLLFAFVAGAPVLLIVAGALITFDWARNLAIEVAHRLPWVKFEKASPPVKPDGS
jgi:hypothetical protein